MILEATAPESSSLKRNLETRRDDPTALRRYLRNNPVYTQELRLRPLWASDGHHDLWTRVVTEALESAATVLERSSQYYQNLITKTKANKNLAEQVRKEQIFNLQQLLNETNQLEHEKRTALQFLESQFFRWFCTECNICPDAALKVIRKRIVVPTPTRRRLTRASRRRHTV